MKRASNIVVRVVHVLVGHAHKSMSKKHRIRRHCVGMSIGVVMMMTGSTIAAHADIFSAGHVVIDTVGYFIHGVGCIPFFSNIEPLYKAMVQE